MTFYCSVHREQVADDAQRVLVSAIEQGSGPGIPLYACRLCVTQHSIKPFDLPDDVAPCLPPTGVQRAP